MNFHMIRKSLFCFLVLMAFNIQAANEVMITDDGNYRYIKSNGIPDHATGNFPNSGNPNSISVQNHNFRVTLHPEKTGHATPVQLSGVAINGIPMDPGTAEFWNRDRSSGWNIQAFAKGTNLGIDQNNAHVQPNGTYHYHAVPTGLIKQTSNSLVGWAADGFEIHYAGSRAKSSYQLKSGTRPSGPKGKYDGTYDHDWEYVAGSGTLDECNGGELNGQYVYFITDTYPFIQRCVFGQADASFIKRGPGPGEGPGSQRDAGRDRPPPDGHRHPPPPERR